MSDAERAGVELFADTSEFESGMAEASSQIGDLAGIASGIGEAGLSALAGAFDVVATVAGDAFDLAISGATSAIGFLWDGIQGGIGDALAAEQQMNSLNRVINNLGDSAPLTGQQANDLAAQFATLAGGSDDAVLAIIDLGLRSQQISEQEFPGFIQASLDLGAVMGDNTRAAKLLAMAQDDPLAAYKQIEKATGSYSTAVEEQIKAMMEAGNTSGALELVMGELATTTGGAALQNTQTLAGTIELFTNTISEAWETIGTAFLPVLHTLADMATTTLIPAITDLAAGFGVFFERLLSGGDVADSFEGTIGTLNALIPGLGTGLNTFTYAIEDLYNFVAENLPAIQETFTTVWGSIQVATQALSDVWTTSLGPALSNAFATIFGEGPTAQEILTALLDALSVGAQVAADWVVNTLVPAVVQFSDWITNNFVPRAIEVRDWLEVNLPIAIQTLSDFWNNVLMPAVDAAVAFWTNTLVPAFTTLQTWLQTNLPAAIQTLTDFWTNTLMPAVDAAVNFWNTKLLPALTAVQSFIDTSVSPTLTSLGAVFTEVNRIVGEVFVLTWNTVLKPALDSVWRFIQDNVNPILTEMGRVFNEVIGPAVGGFKTDVLDPLKGAFDSLAGTLQTVRDWLDRIAEALANIHIPGDLTPGSPTPFEIGMRGIADALGDVTAQMLTLDRINSAMDPISLLTGGASGSLSLERPALSPVSMGGGITYNNNVVQNITNARYMPPGNMFNDMRQGLNAAMS